MTESRPDYKARKFYDPMDDILDRPIAFNPAFKRITGSTNGALLLSQAWYWSKRHKQDNGWFWKTGKEWEEETGLTRTEQETARRNCRDVGVIEEKLKGVPATLYFRVSKARVYELLGVQFAETLQTEFAETLQTGLDGLRENAETLQSADPANINKESETPAMIPTENEDVNTLLDILEQAAISGVFEKPERNPRWRVMRSDLEAGSITRVDGTITISGMGDSAPIYQDNYARPFERALVGILNEEVRVVFQP